MKLKHSVFLGLGALALTGCSLPKAPTVNSELRTEVAQKAAEREANLSVTATVPKVVESEQAYIPLTRRKVSEHAWLRAMRVTVQTGREPVPMSEVLRALSQQGLTITSELPLDRFTYAGFSLLDVDAESALRAVVTSVGLDYQADAQRRLVVIKPMASRTWYLNMGNRRSSFAAGGNNSANPSTTNAVAKAVSSSGAGGASSSDSNSGGSSDSGKSEVSSSDDFWASLTKELEARLTVLLPDPPKPSAASAAPAPMGAAPSARNALPPLAPDAQVPAAAQPQAAATPPALAAPTNGPAAATTDGLLASSSRQVGTFSTNPETGAVTVQAPHWLLEDLDVYFKRVQSMYNTDISFQGELLMLSTDTSRSEGLDISAFARFASNRYGVVYRNNGLGGVTVTFPNGNSLVPSVSAAAGAVAGPLLGIQSPIDGLQVFSAYLSNMGRVSTLQKPVLTTTSGVPADFRRTVTRYFNSVSQEAASGGTGSAAVGTKNQLIPQDFGTILRVNPRIDVATGLIRAQIELVQTTQMGVQTVTQTVTSGDSVEQIPTQLPIVSRILYSGEALLRDGDLVVMGGQTEDAENSSRDGITGLMDVPQAGSLFGKTLRERNRNVFYFALRVSVNRR